MKFTPFFEQGVLLKRYKRFLADVRRADGNTMTVHCPNTGSMKNCLLTEAPCWYSTSDSKTRKYPHTLEITTTPSGHLAGVNTGRANTLVKEAIETGKVPELSGYQTLQTEVRYGQEKSRIDIQLGNPGEETLCYVEVKNVTLLEDDKAEGLGTFPDAVSTRGTKHLRELIHMREQGHRAVLFYCVQHTGITHVKPADDIDPAYGKTLREAIKSGVEVLAYRAEIGPGEIVLNKKIPFTS